MEKHIDDIIEDNLYEQIKFFLNKDITNNKYDLHNLIQNYYTFLDKLYIKEIKNDICDRFQENIDLDKINKSINSYKFMSIIYGGVAVLGIGTHSIFWSFFGVFLFAFNYMKNRKDISTKRDYDYGEILRNSEENKWENVLNNYKKEYLEIIK